MTKTPDYHHAGRVSTHGKQNTSWMLV